MRQIVVTLDIPDDTAAARPRLALALERLSQEAQRSDVACQIQLDGQAIDQDNVRQQLLSA